MTQKIKKLYKSYENRIIAGVAGGLGEYFNVDPLFIRLLFIFLSLVHGFGILFYVIFIFILPKQRDKALDAHGLSKKLKKFSQEVTEQAEEATERIEKQSKGFFQDRKKIIGLVILLVGLLALLNRVAPMAWFQWDIFWRVALIVVGFYLLIKTDKKEDFEEEEISGQEKISDEKEEAKKETKEGADDRQQTIIDNN